MPATSAIETAQLVHRYGERMALAGLDLLVERGEIFALLGPNGGGKTTLFRLLSTLIPIQQGRASVLGYDVARQTNEVRRRIGVVFQAPSLDKKLTVDENLHHQGRLYGLYGKMLNDCCNAMLERLRLADRRRDLVETLSGGLRRRAELAKGMLHGPQLLLLDEPSNGLDPAARRRIKTGTRLGLDPAARSDLWDYLRQIRGEEGVTVVLTTHLLEEADKADRLAILNAGSLVALDTPERLRASVGGDTITIETEDAAALAGAIADRLGLAAHEVDGSVRLELPDASQWVPRLVEAFPGQIQTITLGKPTLEDVFIARTGHKFWADTSYSASDKS